MFMSLPLRDFFIQYAMKNAHARLNKKNLYYPRDNIAHYETHLASDIFPDCLVTYFCSR